jgi:hypothetical protein
VQADSGGEGMKQQTTAESRDALRHWYGSPPERLRHVDAPDILAALDDADALADALAEIKRLRDVLTRVCVVAATGDTGCNGTQVGGEGTRNL